jgi:uncharacterized protein
MPSDRSSAVDLVRAAALVGIAVVNLPFMALPFVALAEPPAAGADRAAVLLVELLFQAKFFLLFSFVFGWGIEVQAAAALRVGASFTRRFARRLAALAVMGALHAVLVFSGDILLLYATLGLVAWALRGRSVRGLMALAAGLVPVAAVGLMVVAVLLADVPLPPSVPNLGGSYAETVATRLRDWPQNFVFLVLFQGPLALAAFVAGMAAARVGFFDAGNAVASRLARAAPVLCAAGLALNALYALGIREVDSPVLATLALASLALGGPTLAAAWLGLILRAAPTLRLPGFVVLAGRNSLSCYVLQGILAGVLFGGYGLGLFGQLGQAVLLPLSVVIAGLAMALVAAVARRAGQGPLEWLLRRVTYG